MKQTVVVFEPNKSPRILVNPEKSLYIDKPHALNPNMDKLRTIPPHLWELRGNKIVGLSHTGKERIADIETEVPIGAEIKTETLLEKAPTLTPSLENSPAKPTFNTNSFILQLARIMLLLLSQAAIAYGIRFIK